MKLQPEPAHSIGELISNENSEVLLPVEMDTFDGKVWVQWDPDVSVSP